MKALSVPLFALAAATPLVWLTLGAVWGGVINDHVGLAWLGGGGAALAVCGAVLASLIPANVPSVEGAPAPADNSARGGSR